MIVLTSPRFNRSIKKILPAEKIALDLAIKDLITNPLKGEIKKGDLAGIRVYKFRFLKQQMLLAYSINLENTQLVLLGYGVHENFYRDLKR